MTLRARPVARRRSRAGWDSGDRRNSLINLGFFLAIGLSIVILIGYAAWSWYDDHFGAAATVNGQVITKDDLRSRQKIESFRLDYIESRIQTLMATGRLSRDDGLQQIQFIAQRRDQIANLALERLVDVTLMTKLAADNGVQVTEADVDQQLAEEATIDAQRHVWMIEVEPNVDPRTGEVGDEQKREALGRAQRAVARLRNGESWEDVARTASDSALAPQAGDLNWVAKESGYDEAFMEAVFAAPLNQPTDVIEGEDGTYRIGRATEEAPAQVDPDFGSQVELAGIKLADYRVAVRGDVVRTKLSEKVVADLSKPGIQRNVLEIRLPEPNTSSVEGEQGTKVRWIVFAPKDSMANASELKPDDPAWAKAKAEAEAMQKRLVASPNLFDELARTSSDEASGRDNGGKQPWIYPGSSIDAALKNALIDKKDGEVLAPVKAEDGWYVIQVIRRTGEGDKAYLESLKAKATDEASFRQLARDNSEGEGVAKGGEMGWIARGQLATAQDTAIFAAPVGGNSDVIEVEGDGTYLFRILGEETRQPTEEQLKIFKDNGFSYWYTQQKEKATIDYPLGSSSLTG